MSYESKSYSLSDDVIEALAKLAAEHGSVNKGLRSLLLGGETITPAIEKRIAAQVRPRKQSSVIKTVDRVADDIRADDGVEIVTETVARRVPAWRRPPRPKGDKSR